MLVYPWFITINFNRNLLEYMYFRLNICTSGRGQSNKLQVGVSYWNISITVNVVLSPHFIYDFREKHVKYCRRVSFQQVHVFWSVWKSHDIKAKVRGQAVVNYVKGNTYKRALGSDKNLDRNSNLRKTLWTLVHIVTGHTQSEIQATNLNLRETSWALKRLYLKHLIRFSYNLIQYYL